MVSMSKSSIASKMQSKANSMSKDISKNANSSMKKPQPVGEIETIEHLNLETMFGNLTGYDLLVGIPDSENERAENSNITNSQLAYIHTHGVVTNKARAEIENQVEKDKKFEGKRGLAYKMYIQSHGSPAFKIPPRPIIEPALEFYKDKLSEMMGKALDFLLSGDYAKGENQLKLTGIRAQNFVRGWFNNESNNWPPNAKSTIDSKGSDNPLIDTGELRKSITYVIEKPSVVGKAMKAKSKIEKLGR